MNPNTQQTTGEHLLLIRGTHWNSSLSPAELQRIMTDFYGWVEDLQSQGILRGAQPLMEEGKLVTGAQTSRHRRRLCRVEGSHRGLFPARRGLHR